MNVILIMLGTVLLALGRRLFWFFIGVVGFLAGLTFAPRLFEGQPAWVILVFALVAGLIGTALAVFLQRVAIALVGFFAAGYVLTNLLMFFGIDLGGFAIMLFIIAGVFGAVLASAMFDWALIVLSALTGAVLMVQGLSSQVPGFGETLSALMVFILFLVGVAIQAGLLSRGRPGRAY